MTAKQKKTLFRILLSLALFAGIFIADKAGALRTLPRPVLLVFYLIPYLIIGYDVLRKAVVNILHGNAFDESFLMTVATIAAFVIGEYPEATAVMLFYQVGELFQSIAVGRSRRSIADLMSIAPDFANLEKDGAVTEVDPEDVAVDDVIVVRPGERVPLDGTVLSGESFLDTAALTGEAVPRRVAAGDAIISGCVNGEGTLRIRVTHPYEDSTVSKILDLVENASTKKTRVENFITRFARIYTPIVTIAAAALAVLPPLVTGSSFGPWIHRACVFLIVSCPCALVISVPLSFFGGIGAASRIGVLVKGSNCLEMIAATTAIAFDKTGTLTTGEFRVTEVVPASSADITEKELLRIAAHAEAFSTHPIALSIRAAHGGKIDADKVTDVRERAGFGVCARFEDRDILAGSAALLAEAGVAFPQADGNGTLIYIAAGDRFLGHIRISDPIKEGAAAAIRSLRSSGIRRTALLSGDRRASAEAVAAALGIDEVHAELLPADKIACVEKLLSEQREKEMLAFVGDGINDAPVLMRADVGLAMGALGSDAAIEAADIVLMDDNLQKIARVTNIGRKTMKIARENIAFSLAVKLLILVLGVFGLASMWLAVFGDVGVTVLAVLNAMRAGASASTSRGKSS